MKTTNSFWIKVSDLQPSQLFINKRKLDQVTEWFDPSLGDEYEPLPVIKLRDRLVLTDGHTRAFTYFKYKISEVKVYWDEDELDLDLYQACVSWCQDNSITQIGDLQDCIISDEDFKKRWIERCQNYEPNK